jgi:two-component system CheB/CheR fusion protein
MSKNPSNPPKPAESGLEALLSYLKRARGIDYGSYKKTTLERRFHKRIQMLNIECYEDYIDYLKVHPDEFKLLLNHVVINVTDFFRDEQAWCAIRDDILPRILADKQPDEPVRVWSAGCASGQEACTILMLLHEAMGEAAFRQQVKIYATDVDDEALNEARLAVYLPDRVKSVPADLRKKYFDNINGNFVFKKEMRRAVIFGRHDLLADAPISRIDLLICRNVMMYFNSDAQARILARFGFALSPNGFLFLGMAEVMAARSSAFVAADLKNRIFAKAGRDNSDDDAYQDTGSANEQNILNTQDSILHSMALEVDTQPQMVLNARNELVVVNAPARSLLGLRTANRPLRLQDLLIAYRPIDLHHLIKQVNTERSVVLQRDVKWTMPNSDVYYYDVTALPLIDAGGNLLGVKIVFNDVSLLHKLQADLQMVHYERETLNEELQSTNEELETTNEELQSTNEELETMNEELQSTNEELGTVNDELRQRQQEFRQLNAFLESIMYGIREALIVLDRNLQVQRWNRMAENLWGLRSDEVIGQHFFNLDIGLPVDKLNTMIRTTLNEGNWDNNQEVVLQAVNRRGRTITVMVTATPLMEDTTRQGIILVVKEVASQGEPDPKLNEGEQGHDSAG